MSPHFDEKKEDVELAPTPSNKVGDTYPLPIQEDAVFGEITEEGPNYRNVSFPNP